MRLLLDTHVLLWALISPERLPSAAREALESRTNEVLFSAASIWELGIKAQIGRIQLPFPVGAFVEACLQVGFRELVVNSAHAARSAELPMHHRDPFDRILVAQAIHEPARLLTADRMLLPYTDLVELLP